MGICTTWWKLCDGLELHFSWFVGDPMKTGDIVKTVKAAGNSFIFSMTAWLETFAQYCM